MLQGTHGILMTVFLHALGGVLGLPKDEDPNFLGGM